MSLETHLAELERKVWSGPLAQLERRAHRVQLVRQERLGPLARSRLERC